LNAAGGGRILVTGADGFMGSHLVERLLAEGRPVRAFCLYNSNGARGWLDEVPESPALEVRLGDVRDARFVEEACRDVDVVYHLAALIAVPYSYQAPQSFLETNALGTLNLLEGARRAGCRRLVHASTSEVYGTAETLPIRETHPLKAQSPYSASKIAADKLCEAYAASFGTPVVVVRPFNTYGPRQSTRAVLPTILTQLLSGADELRLGSLDPRRDLTYVADTVDGFVRAGMADGLRPGEVIQLGTGDAVSVGELAERAMAVVGHRARLVRDPARVRPQESEVMALVSDPARARQSLGWEPRISLDEGLRRTADWFRARTGRYRVGAYQV
jgi:NAD dependent epimerase/dehydratase